MTSHGSFVRKIIYLVAIAVLLMPMFWLSQPATSALRGVEGSPGGQLARLREQYHLNPAPLGEIDPGSVTLKLATLGMRGVAANILWEKANEFKMKKDWANFGATLNQIAKIQPNFINVWSNQAWNLSYNISVEFDDYRQRYRWVIKGIDFLKEGIKHNQRQPRLLWDTGWTISQKIGKADEAKHFRRLFREADDFHGSRPLAERDNWLVGQKWFQDAVAMVEQGATMMGKSPLLYRSNAPMCQMSYAENLEKDGTFGEVARAAWQEAARQWERYGTEEIPTTFQDENQQPIIIQLGRKEMHEEEAKKLAEQLDALDPGLRERLAKIKREALTPAQREALDTPLEKRTGRQHELAAQAKADSDVTLNEVARNIPAGPKRKKALELAKQAEKHLQLATYISRYRDIVNYAYWRLRAEVEQEPDMIAARKSVYDGDRALAEGDLIAARDNYQRGFEGWRKVLDRHPGLVSDESTLEGLIDSIKQYRRILGQLDEPMPDRFLLQDVVDAYHKSRGEPAPPK